LTGFHFGRFLPAKPEFSLALRLQWFESSPAHASSKAILQVLKPFGWQLGIRRMPMVLLRLSERRGVAEGIRRFRKKRVTPLSRMNSLTSLVPVQ
jgi:hypothetical protein